MLRIVLGRCRKFFSLKEIYLKELRGRWGRCLNTYRDRSDIALLYPLTRLDTTRKSVADSTWNDLGMHAVFDLLDGNILWMLFRTITQASPAQH